MSEFFSDIIICHECGSDLAPTRITTNTKENKVESVVVHGECIMCDTEWKFDLTISEE